MSFLQTSPCEGVDLSKLPESRVRNALPILTLLAAMSVWLWPIGLGGRMPVGGDATQFSMGLMAFLGDSLHQGQNVEWNDLWGFGFPGLAESQMGVYYPPHMILYRWFSVEFAYTASLVFHTYFGAIGAYWASRKFGVSRWGSALSGFAWSASGMFVIHLPHQWGYTTGSWMPWAVGLGGMVISTGAILPALMLSAVLALQVLPGHFQFAFDTQVLLLLMAVWTLIERPRGTKAAIVATLAIVGAIAGSSLLAGCQLLPTWQLARTAQSQRTFDYLSAFPATPLHLSSYVAPNLFYLSPLWRPLAWDPFHAMPEEHRPYLGLVPLMLALGVIRRGFRTRFEVRLLTFLAVSSLLLSLGPYVPGFSQLIRLPGFSFFRAPARWGLSSCLILAILAGQGVDSWKTWPRPGRSAVKFVVFAALIPVLIVVLLELAFVSSQGAGKSSVAEMYDAVLKRLPWPNEPSFSQVMASTRRGPRDPLILTNLMAQGVDPRVAGSMRLERERHSIYLRELTETFLLLAGMLGIAVALARKWRYADLLLGLFVLTDLLLLSRHRAIQTAPIRPLTEQSTVLNRLSKLPRGTRSIDGLRNLPMVARVAPLAAYRTLDRPVLTNLVALASAPADGSVDPKTLRETMRALGASVRVIDPLEPPSKLGEPVADPVLASWLYGEWGKKAPPFRVWKLDEPATRAFFVPGTVATSTDPASILRELRRAIPLKFEAIAPGEFRIIDHLTEPGVVIVSVLDDPNWQVFDDRDDSSPRELEPISIFGTPGGGAWQSVRISNPGPIHLRWIYSHQTDGIGQLISFVSWGCWVLGMVVISFLRMKPLAPSSGSQ